MLPGYGTPVAGVSGTGVHDTPREDWGHGGAGGLIAPTAWSCWISLVRVGKNTGCAEATAAQPRALTTAPASKDRRIRRNLDLQVWADQPLDRSAGAFSRKRKALWVYTRARETGIWKFGCSGWRMRHPAARCMHPRRPPAHVPAATYWSVASTLISMPASAREIGQFRPASSAACSKPG